MILVVIEVRPVRSPRVRRLEEVQLSIAQLRGDMLGSELRSCRQGSGNMSREMPTFAWRSERGRGGDVSKVWEWIGGIR